MHGQRDLLGWQDEDIKRENVERKPAEEMKALYWMDALKVSGERRTDGVRSSTYSRGLAFMILFCGSSASQPLRMREDQPSSCVGLRPLGNGDPVVALRV